MIILLQNTSGKAPSKPRPGAIATCPFSLFTFGFTTITTPLSIFFCPTPQRSPTLAANRVGSSPSKSLTVSTVIWLEVAFESARNESSILFSVESGRIPAKSFTNVRGASIAKMALAVTGSCDSLSAEVACSVAGEDDCEAEGLGAESL